MIPISYSSVSCRCCIRCAKRCSFCSPVSCWPRLLLRCSRWIWSRHSPEDFHFANYRFSFRKLQILISQTTDFHFANYRFSFCKLQIFISSRSISFRFISFRSISFRESHALKVICITSKRTCRKSRVKDNRILTVESNLHTLRAHALQLT